MLFIGWFGPRGLASIVLGLVYLEQGMHQPGEYTIRLAVMMTVLLSIFAHGLSALPGINLYAAKVAKLTPVRRSISWLSEQVTAERLKPTPARIIFAEKKQFRISKHPIRRIPFFKPGRH